MGHGRDWGELEGRGQALFILAELRCLPTQLVRHRPGKSFHKPQATSQEPAVLCHSPCLAEMR